MRRCVEIRRNRIHKTGDGDCRCDVPVCMAAGFSPVKNELNSDEERKKNEVTFTLTAQSPVLS